MVRMETFSGDIDGKTDDDFGDLPLIGILSEDTNSNWFITIYTVVPSDGTDSVWYLQSHEKYRARLRFIYSLAHAFRERAGNNQVVAVSKEDGSVDYAFIGALEIEG